MAKSRKVSSVIISGSLAIGFKLIGPLPTSDAVKFCDEIKKEQNPDIGHAELMIVHLFSLDEARQEIKERGHLMSPDWLCTPRKL